MAIVAYGRERVRRKSVPLFVKLMAERHPELRTQVTHADFMKMAGRDHVHVRLVEMPDRQRARTFAIGTHQFLQLNRSMAIGEQTLQGMHELCHVWRQGPQNGTYYSDELTGGAACEFADLFAWYVTSSARPAWDPDSRQLDLEF